MSEEDLEKALDEIFKEDIQSIRERMKALMRSYDNSLEDSVRKDRLILELKQRLNNISFEVEVAWRKIEKVEEEDVN